MDNSEALSVAAPTVSAHGEDDPPPNNRRTECPTGDPAAVRVEMTRVEVDTAELVTMSESIRGAALEAEAATADRHDLIRTAAGLVDPELIATVSLFVDAWNEGLEELVDDAHRFADALALLAEIYEDAEVAVRSGLLDNTATPVLGPSHIVAALPAADIGTPPPNDAANP